MFTRDYKIVFISLTGKLNRRFVNISQYIYFANLSLLAINSYSVYGVCELDLESGVWNSILTVGRITATF